MPISEENVITIGEDTASVLLYLVGIAFPPALAFIAVAKIVLPLVGAVAPVIMAAVEKGGSAFAAADAAHPGLGAQITTLAARIPVDVSLSASVSHLDNVTMMLVAKSTKGFAVPGWTDAATKQWMDDPTVPEGGFSGG